MLLCLTTLITSACGDDFKDGADVPTQVLATLFRAPVEEPANLIAASMDGSYLYTLEYTRTGVNGHARLYVSKNGGGSWETFNVGLAPLKDPVITTGGYTCLATDTKRILYDLNAGQEIAINYPGSLTQGDNFVLGNDDFIYLDPLSGDKKSYRKIAETTWTDFTMNGVYCGQDVATGGAAFYDPGLKQLHLHNPVDNTINTIDITIDVTQVTQGQIHPNRPPRYRYDGSNRLAIACTKGVAVQNLTSGDIQYTFWDGDFKGHYLNPVSVSIDSEGKVFASLTSATRSKSYKISGGTHENIPFVRCGPVSRGKYTYYAGALRLVRESADAKKEFGTSYQQLPNPRRADLLSARVVDGKKFALLRIASSFNVLATYAEEQFHPFRETEGTYLYALGDQVYVYGPDRVLHSPDKGVTWQEYGHHLSGAVRSIGYVAWSGGTYVGLAVSNLSVGNTEDKHTLSTYSSSDGIQWTLIADSKGRQGTGPHSMRTDGIMTNVFSWIDMFYVSRVVRTYSEDFGETWHIDDDLKYKLFDSQHGDRIYVLEEMDDLLQLTEYNMNFDVLKTRRFENPGYGTHYGIKQTHVNEKGKVYYIIDNYFVGME